MIEIEKLLEPSLEIQAAFFDHHTRGAAALEAARRAK
jgi:hypothetical protein